MSEAIGSLLGGYVTRPTLDSKGRGRGAERSSRGYRDTKLGYLERYSRSAERERERERERARGN